MISLSSLTIQWILPIFLLLSPLLQAEEKLFIPFDDRSWKVGYKAHDQNEQIIEFILPNDDIHHWKELFTVQVFKHLPVTASEFVTALEQSSRKNVPAEEKLEMEIVEKDPFNILEQSFISKQPQEKGSYDEYNIGRVIKGKTHLYYIRYSSKDPNVFKQNKEAWIQRFKLAYLAPAPVENQQGRWLTFTSSKKLQDSPASLH